LICIFDIVLPKALNLIGFPLNVYVLLQPIILAINNNGTTKAIFMFKNISESRSDINEYFANKTADFILFENKTNIDYTSYSFQMKFMGIKFVQIKADS